MGTRLELVLTEAPTTPLREIARSLVPHVTAETDADVIAYLNIAEHRGVRLLSVEVSGGVEPDLVAQQLSRSGSPAIHLWYSDSVGEAGSSWFADGIERGREEAQPDEPRMYLWLQKGLSRTFPAWSELGPEDMLDILYSPEATSESFVLARPGVVLPVPETYVPPPEKPHRPSLLDSEFALGRLPRRMLRGCALFYGALAVGGILFVLCWWAWEVLR